MNKFLIALFCVISATAGFASEPNQNSIELKKKQTNNDRPYSIYQIIDCYYDGEDLYIDFLYSEGDCILYVVPENGPMQCHNFSSDISEVISIGQVGNASLTITTENGNTYEGVIVDLDY